MKIAITGGAGRVGKHISNVAVAQGHTVVAIDRIVPPVQHIDHIQVVQADIGDYESISNAIAGCDALIHLAAIPAPIGHADYIVHNNNVVGSYNTIHSAIQHGITKICQASSVNAIGAMFSRKPHFDYFPIDEQHPTYNEDPYSLSKWICEQQADSFARRYENLTISSLRFHWVVPDHATAVESGKQFLEYIPNHLWGYVAIDAVADACLRAIQADFQRHEVFQIIAPDTMIEIPSAELIAKYYPHVEIRRELTGFQGFFDCSKAARLLGWQHS